MLAWLSRNAWSVGLSVVMVALSVVAVIKQPSLEQRSQAPPQVITAGQTTTATATQTAPGTTALPSPSPAPSPSALPSPGATITATSTTTATGTVTVGPSPGATVTISITPPIPSPTGPTTAPAPRNQAKGLEVWCLIERHWLMKGPCDGEPE